MALENLVFLKPCIINEIQAVYTGNENIGPDQFGNMDVVET